MADRSQHLKYKQSGIALILVLWLMALLTVIAGSYNLTMRTESRLAAHHLQSAQAVSLAEAGIWLGVYELLKPEPEQTWRHDGSTNLLEFAENRIEVSLFNEAGKIDLNAANVDLIQSVFTSTHLPARQSEQLTHKVLDWRDQDNLRHPYGAEDDDYTAAGLAYGAKDSWFNSVEELRMIPGITEPVFNDIAPALTVYSHQTAINPRYAPSRVLHAIPGMTEIQVDDYIRSRIEQTSEPDIPPGVEPGYFYGGRSNIYTVSSTASVHDARMRIDAVLLLKPNAIPPIALLSWQESPPK